MEKMKVNVCGQAMELSAQEVENLLAERDATIGEQAAKLSQVSVELEEARKSKEYWYDAYCAECKKFGEIQKSMDVMRNVFNETAERWK